MVAKNTFYVIFVQLPTTRFSMEIGKNNAEFRPLYSLDVVQMCFEILLIL